LGDYGQDLGVEVRVVEDDVFPAVTGREVEVEGVGWEVEVGSWGVRAVGVGTGDDHGWEGGEKRRGGGRRDMVLCFGGWW
jgi:hypothetical protein